MPSVLAPCLVAAILLLPFGCGAYAGILLEAALGGTPVRVEVGPDPSRTLATVAGRRYLVDLGPGEVRALDGLTPERPQPVALSAPVLAPPSSLEHWSEGPVVADHGSTYHVLIVGERICAEVLASSWMTDFTRPLVRTVELLQRAEPQLAPGPHGPCPPVGFGVYASDGFPLLVGYKGEPLFRVTRLRFDHRPAAGDLARPADTAAEAQGLLATADADLTRRRLRAAGYPLGRHGAVPHRGGTADEGASSCLGPGQHRLGRRGGLRGEPERAGRAPRRGACFERAREFDPTLQATAISLDETKENPSPRVEQATEITNRGIVDCLDGRVQQGVSAIEQAIETLRS